MLMESGTRPPTIRALGGCQLRRPPKNTLAGPKGTCMCSQGRSIRRTSPTASKGIGAGQVRVPKYLFKLVYDENQHRAWAHWHLNDNATQASRPISYSELVRHTDIEFLPGAQLSE